MNTEGEYPTLQQLELESAQLLHRVSQLNINFEELIENNITLDSFCSEFEAFKKDYLSYFPWRMKRPPHTRREIPDHILHRRYQ